MTFVAHDPTDSNLKCVVSTHVDDFRALDNCPYLTRRLHDALKERFEEVTGNCPSTSFAGVSLIQHSNGACSVHQAPYIERVASLIGVVHMPPVDVPCEHDIFKRSITASDCLPVDTNIYCSLTGHLIQSLKTRDEHRHIVSHLCSRNSTPDVGDYRKALHLLRYLYTTRFMGRVFSSSSTVIFAHADAAFANHLGGLSSEAFFLSVGSANAPFASRAKAQTDVATCPMIAEYMSATSSCKAIELFRRFSEELGWLVSGPTVLRVDNNTARCLATAPEVTKGALHLNVGYHYIRQLIVQGIVVLEQVTSAAMRADVMTKVFARAVFKRLRDSLLNRSALPTE